MKRQAWPIAIYLSFCAIILGAYLVYQPGWGFMDDLGARGLAKSFWWGDTKWEILKVTFTHDIYGGRFRPLYYWWAMTFYGIFQNHPLLFNLFLTTVGLLSLPLWGRILQKTLDDNDPRLMWVLPLSFFIFTPFWNMFMYLSIQERYFLVAGAIGFLAYLRAKEKRSIPWIVFSWFVFFLITLGKETGLAMMIPFALASLVDGLWLSREKKINGTFVVFSLLFGIPYCLFLSQKIIGGHYPGTENYLAENSVGGFSSKIANIPLICKAIILVGVIPVLVFIYDRFISKKNSFQNPMWLLFPLCLTAYLGILIPWGYPSYLLSPVSIFLFPTLYGFLSFMNARQKTIFYFCGTGLSLLVVVFNVLPSIELMADKRKITEVVATQYRDQNTVIYFPPPYVESSDSLTGFSGANIVFVKDVLKDSRLDFKKKNYILMHLECGPVELQNSRAGAEVYRSSTWSMEEILPDPGHVNVVAPKFKVNFLKTLKKKIKSF